MSESVVLKYGSREYDATKQPEQVEDDNVLTTLLESTEDGEQEC